MVESRTRRSAKRYLVVRKASELLEHMSGERADCQ